tara:strand:- start:690 stop:1037 length:348 start_codon:yes stop_codon:yes gene_type:complete
MKLTKTELAEINDSKVNPFGNVIQKPIKKSLVERVAEGKLSQSTWKDSHGWVEVSVQVWPLGLDTVAKRVNHKRVTGSFAKTVFETTGSGSSKAKATRDAYAKAIKHFTSKEVAA